MMNHRPVKIVTHRSPAGEQFHRFTVSVKLWESRLQATDSLVVMMDSTVTQPFFAFLKNWVKRYI
jgi:hypothetical protein